MQPLSSSSRPEVADHAAHMCRYGRVHAVWKLRAAILSYDLFDGFAASLCIRESPPGPEGGGGLCRCYSHLTDRCYRQTGTGAVLPPSPPVSGAFPVSRGIRPVIGPPLASSAGPPFVALPPVTLLSTHKCRYVGLCKQCFGVVRRLWSPTEREQRWTKAGQESELMSGLNRSNLPSRFGCCPDWSG